MSGPKSDLPKYADLPPVPGMPPGCAWGIWDTNGVKDQIGSLNLLTPENMLKAKEEIQTGVSVSLKLVTNATETRRELTTTSSWPLERIEDPGHNRRAIVHKFLDLKPNLVGHDDEIYINTQTSSQWDGLRKCIYCDCTLFR